MWEDNELIVDEIDDVLEHHGIKGQKWGVRRYQNDDGSLTALGKKRLAKGEVKVDKPKRKSVKEMNASELRAEIERRALATKLSEVDQKKTKIGRFLQKMSSKNKSADDLRVEIEKQELKNELKAMGKKPKEEAPPKEEPKNRHELTKRDLKDLNDKELSDAIERAALEQRFRQLHPEEKSFLQKTAEKLRDRVADAAIDATVQVGKEYLIDSGKKALGLTDAEYNKLKSESEKVNFKKNIDDYHDKSKGKKNPEYLDLAGKELTTQLQNIEKLENSGYKDQAQGLRNKLGLTKKNNVDTSNPKKENSEKDEDVKTNKNQNDETVVETKSSTAKSMARSGKSVSEIADDLGVSTSTVSDMLDGQTARAVERKSGDKGNLTIYSGGKTESKPQVNLVNKFKPDKETKKSGQLSFKDVYKEQNKAISEERKAYAAKNINPMRSNVINAYDTKKLLKYDYKKDSNSSTVKRGRDEVEELLRKNRSGQLSFF